MRKIFLLGPVSSGKTTFCNKIMGKAVDLTGYKSTPKVEIFSKPVEAGQNLQIFDTPGGGAASPSLLKMADVVYVFCDTTVGDGLGKIRTEFNLDTLRAQAKEGAKFILVASKLGTSMPHELTEYARTQGYDAVLPFNVRAGDVEEQSAALLKPALDLFSPRATPAAAATAALALARSQIQAALPAPAPAVAFAAAPAPAPAPADAEKAALIGLIQGYQDRRGRGREYYWFGIETFFGGRSRTQKLDAAAALLAVLNGNTSVSLGRYVADGDFAAGSKLGNLYTRYLASLHP